MFNFQRTATLRNPFYMKQNFLNKIHTIDTLHHLSLSKPVRFTVLCLSYQATNAEDSFMLLKNFKNSKHSYP